MKNKSSAYSYALFLLSRRNYSQYKLKKKLLSKEYPLNEIEEAINKLIEKEFLKEASYIQYFVTKWMNKSYSLKFIQQKLKAEEIHLTPESIQEIFDDNQMSESDQIQKLIEAKWRKKTKAKDLYQLKGQLFQFLLRRGHSFALSKEAINKFVQEQDLKD